MRKAVIMAMILVVLGTAQVMAHPVVDACRSDGERLCRHLVSGRWPTNDELRACGRYLLNRTRLIQPACALALRTNRSLLR